ncbi:MAG: FMN-binding negative transcriptional regulator [Proteobacteria bacterium]|jgi:transcriptional regulator|nr:FMN-binding negative transcriptional regulator [Pseudomonadota bacterium]MDA1289807.1 FMN-binding negative transcriptional regulator [Pseudomonadota bacterium]
MYIPKHFEITDKTEVSKFIKANSFGQLISVIDTAIVSTHVPFLFDAESRVLMCHIAKANPQWQQIQKQKVLVTLQGEHAYVSPNWYESAGVPTWNYQAVHIEGIAESFTDPEKLKRVVDTLTEQNESDYPNPWEPDYAASMLRGIVGIEIAITSIQCKYKLSQNRSVRDQFNVQEQLADGGHEALANAMNKS